MRLSPLLFAAGLAAACSTVRADEPTPAAASAPPAAAAPKSTLSLEDIRTFTAVFSLVKQGYVEDVSDQRLMQAAIRGLLADLDPHSEYLDGAQIEELNEDTTGSYAGLGIEVVPMDGVLRVIAPIDDTPAERAGIKAGDSILRIDGKPLSPDDLAGAIDRLRGKPGSEITLSILHEGHSVPVDVTLKREIIRVASVRGRLIEPGYAYLRISQFQAETGNDLRKRLTRLQTENGTPLKGAILDLRSNPGGLVSAAVDVSDIFLDAGVVVTTRGRIKEAELSFSATPGDQLAGAPLVVLVDNGSASAAEIVAGALKDNHRALLMGRRTFGKGSVQTILPLDAEHAIKLTTARYYTPSGVSIQAQGIVPDIALSDLALTRRDAPPTPMLSERDLRNHLQGVDEAVDLPSVEQDEEIQSDYALNEALNVLKGLALQRRPAPAGKKKG